MNPAVLVNWYNNLCDSCMNHSPRETRSQKRGRIFDFENDPELRELRDKTMRETLRNLRFDAVLISYIELKLTHNQVFFPMVEYIDSQGNKTESVR